mmetsp:Transcript_8596/g.9300  ORF Transcript_8596/g.9300 Transcript_8596/m.9300 type:complete len:521 (-) Transcript_8596:241-1803(-)
MASVKSSSTMKEKILLIFVVGSILNLAQGIDCPSGEVPKLPKKEECIACTTIRTALVTYNTDKLPANMGVSSAVVLATKEKDGKKEAGVYHRLEFEFKDVASTDYSVDSTLVSSTNAEFNDWKLGVIDSSITVSQYSIDQSVFTSDAAFCEAVNPPVENDTDNKDSDNKDNSNTESNNQDQGNGTDNGDVQPSSISAAAESEYSYLKCLLKVYPTSECNQTAGGGIELTYLIASKTNSDSFSKIAWSKLNVGSITTSPTCTQCNSESFNETRQAELSVVAFNGDAVTNYTYAKGETAYVNIKTPTLPEGHQLLITSLRQVVSTLTHSSDMEGILSSPSSTTNELKVSFKVLYAEPFTVFIEGRIRPAPQPESNNDQSDKDNSSQDQDSNTNTGNDNNNNNNGNDNQSNTGNDNDNNSNQDAGSNAGNRLLADTTATAGLFYASQEIAAKAPIVNNVSVVEEVDEGDDGLWLGTLIVFFVLMVIVVVLIIIDHKRRQGSIPPSTRRGMKPVSSKPQEDPEK